MVQQMIAPVKKTNGTLRRWEPLVCWSLTTPTAHSIHKDPTAAVDADD